MKKGCCIFNIGAHYRYPIYKMMDNELHCDFYIGDRVKTELKKFDYTHLQNFKKTLKNKFLFSNFYWQKGALSTLFKKYDYYIITGEPFCLSTWFILTYIKLFTNKKTYLWTHGWYGKENKVKTWIKRVFFNLADTIFLYGDYAKQLMVKEGFREEKLKCIYNSLNYDEQVKIRKQLEITNIFINHFENNYPVICYVGRIQKVKKLDILINALEILNKELFFVNLVIVGKESEDTGIKAIVENKKLNSQVWFMGEIYDEKELGNIFYNSDICVSPGNVGLTAIHSLTYGCPVITHNNLSTQMPEFEVLKEGKTGSFFEKNNAYDLAVKIKEWMHNNQNKKEIISKNCYEIIEERYNPHYQIKLLKSLIK